MGMRVHNVDSKALPLGNNEYETGYVTLAAGAEISVGTMLYRANGAQWAPVVDASVNPPTALCPTALKNEGAASADFSLRPMIAGRVRADMITLNGGVPTDAQLDLLRDYGIIAVKVTDVSRLDNQ